MENQRGSNSTEDYLSKPTYFVTEPLEEEGNTGEMVAHSKELSRSQSLMELNLNQDFISVSCSTANESSLVSEFNTLSIRKRKAIEENFQIIPAKVQRRESFCRINEEDDTVFSSSPVLELGKSEFLCCDGSQQDRKFSKHKWKRLARSKDQKEDLEVAEEGHDIQNQELHPSYFPGDSFHEAKLQNCKGAVVAGPKQPQCQW